MTDEPTMAPTSETSSEPPRLMYVPKEVDRPAKRAPSVTETPTSQPKSRVEPATATPPTAAAILHALEPSEVKPHPRVSIFVMAL